MNKTETESKIDTAIQRLQEAKDTLHRDNPFDYRNTQLAAAGDMIRQLEREVETWKKAANTLDSDNKRLAGALAAMTNSRNMWRDQVYFRGYASQ